MSEGGTVYRCFDDRGRLLYVGLTIHIDTRLSRHSSQSSWWPLCHRVTRQDFDGYLHACEAERVAIRDEGPSENVNVFKTYNERLQELWGADPLPERHRIDIPDTPETRYIVRADPDAPPVKRRAGFKGWQHDTPLDELEVE